MLSSLSLACMKLNAVFDEELFVLRFIVYDSANDPIYLCYSLSPNDFRVREFPIQEEYNSYYGVVRNITLNIPKCSKSGQRPSSMCFG